MKMESRSYQEDAIRNTLNDIRSKQYKSSVLVIPTGGGKTFTAVKILEELINNDMSDPEIIVWVVHRQELLKQALNAMRLLGLDAKEWSANSKELGKITVAMIASTRTLENTMNAEGKFCKFMVIDEAHRRAAPTYKKLENDLKPEFVLCLTATPIRSDNVDLEFDKISYEKSFLDLVSMGYLAKPRYISYKTGLIHKMRRAGDDFNKDDLAALNNEKRNSIIAKDYDKNKSEYGKSIVFCVDVNHAQELQKTFTRLSPSTQTGIITGNMSDKDRAKTLVNFSKGIIDVLFNVQVLTEGYDEPSIQSVILARPIGSEIFYCQAVGRASRPHPSKPYFNIVDYIDAENKYALLAEDWSTRILGIPESPQRKKEREAALSIDIAKSWLKDTGYSGKPPKSKREVLIIDGVLTIQTKQGPKNYLVKKGQIKHLDSLVNFVANNPPRNPSMIMDYVKNKLIAHNKYLSRWPGKFHLILMVRSLYHKFKFGPLTSKGLPVWKYKPIPDFSVKASDETKIRT